MPKITDTKTANFSLRLPVEINQQLQAVADEQRRSRNLAAVMMIELVLGDAELLRRCFSGRQ